MKMIFLDIDGVLNDHTAYANGYCAIHGKRVEILNWILESVPDAQIVLSSAWRYTMTTVSAVETLLCVHGGNCQNRIHGLTEPDEFTHDGPMPPFADRDSWTILGLKLRAMQIAKYVQQHKPSHWVAIDDLPLDVPNLVNTDPKVGLTTNQAREVIRFLTAGESAAGSKSG